MKYLHTMVRVSDLEKSLDFYCAKLGLVELRRVEVPAGRYTLVFLAAPGDTRRAGGADLQLGSRGAHGRPQLRPPRLPRRRHLRALPAAARCGRRRSTARRATATWRSFARRTGSRSSCSRTARRCPRPSRGRRCRIPAPGEFLVGRESDRRPSPRRPRRALPAMGWLQVDLRGLRVPVPHDSGCARARRLALRERLLGDPSSPAPPRSRSPPRSRCSSCARPPTHYTSCSTLTLCVISRGATADSAQPDRRPALDAAAREHARGGAGPGGGAVRDRRRQPARGAAPPPGRRARGERRARPVSARRRGRAGAVGGGGLARARSPNAALERALDRGARRHRSATPRADRSGGARAAAVRLRAALARLVGATREPA